MGSVLRVDPKIPKTQVICLTHIRELSFQIADVYSKICKYSDIKVENYSATNKCNNAHIVVMTLGGLKKELATRGSKLNLSDLRVVVIDEVDYFFADAEKKQAFFDMNFKHFSKIAKLQKLLFSATYPPDVVTAVEEFCEDAF